MKDLGSFNDRTMIALADDAQCTVCVATDRAFQWESVGAVESAMIAILECEFGLLLVIGRGSFCRAIKFNRFCT